MTNCEYCGVLLVRKPKEVSFWFKRRRFCNQKCMGLGLRKDDVGRAAYHRRARAFKKGYCERCGSKQGLAVHHVNRDVTDNSPGNTKTLCAPCHALTHMEEDGPIPNHIQKKSCSICGEPAEALELCWKHYMRMRRWGDPLEYHRKGKIYKEEIQ